MKAVLMVAVIVTALGLIVGSIWYVPFRLSRLFGLKRKWPLYLAEAAMVLLYPASMAILKAVTSEMLDLVAATASVLFGFHIYLTLLVLVFDGVRLVVKVPKKIAAWAAVGLAALLTITGAWWAGSFSVTEIEIPIARLEKDVTLMHISDVHIGPARGKDYLEQIVRETNARKPDLVLINGDLVDGNSALEPGVLSPLSQFNAPVFYTTGNHESYVDTKRALSIIENHGVRILHNEVVETHGIQLVGLDYMNADQGAFDMHAVNSHTIKEELPKIPLVEGKPVILMHHSPVGIEYVSMRGVALMLSGHTHAGQFFPGTLFAPLYFPLTEGLYERDGLRIFVSQGAGTFGPRLRLGSSNEINLIRLKGSCSYSIGKGTGYLKINLAPWTPGRSFRTGCGRCCPDR
jgi:uncharacterized protein